MAALFKDTIDHAANAAGGRLNEAIVLAGSQLDERIKLASKELNATIKQASDELHAQRKLTKEDIHDLVDYAAQRFGETLDSRIEKLRQESSDLITQKLSQVRKELTEAANQQKKVAVRNATIAVGTSILVGLISLLYRKYLHGEIDLLDIFRSTMLAMASGYMLWLVVKHAGAYLQSSQIKRNAVIAGLGYLDVLRPKGAFGHVIVLILIVGVWGVATFSDSIPAFVGK